MRLLLLCTVLLLTACSNAPLRLYDGPAKPAAAIARVAIPIDIDILSLNGKKVEGSNTLLGTADRELELLPGRYQLLVYYNNLWQAEGDSHETIRSRPMIFDLELAAGHSYQMDFTRTRDIKIARQFATHFPVWLTDLINGARVEGQDSGLAFDNSLLNQITGRKVLDTVGSTSTEGNQVIAPLAPQTTVMDAAHTPAATPAAAIDNIATRPATSGGYLDLLKAQWQQANQEEKRSFLQWIGDHP